MDAHTLRYWIGFNRAKGIGPARLRALIQHFGNVESAWNASPEQWRSARLDERTLASLISTRATCDLDAELQAVERAGARVITLEDAEYPALLGKIYDPPPVLYIKGALTEVDRQAIAIVGTRRATSYGKTVTQELVTALVQQRITIVSGLARGIDGAAHQAALDAGGRTIAVMANGIDHVYPREHRRLADAIAERGALITELPVGTRPESWHFAPRNRIVSGLTLGTVVVEAAEKSGALMTANQALDQGREVFAVPGNILSPVSKGANALIRAGATMVTCADDILSELKLNATTSARSEPRVELPPIVGENELEAIILSSLSAEPQHVDDLSHQSGLPIMQVNSTLTILELKGHVQQVGAMQYALTRG